MSCYLIFDKAMNNRTKMILKFWLSNGRKGKPMYWVKKEVLHADKEADDLNFGDFKPMNHAFYYSKLVG